jgi:hypothetical protein
MTCPHAPSKWIGIVTNDPSGRSAPHYSEVTCARQTCIDKAIRSAAGATNQTARLYTYEELR